MRLTEEQINAIIQTAEEIYGRGVKVFLFGSRTKDGEKGGDIDLIIQADEKKMTLKNKLSFLVLLKKDIGDQKVDVVYERKGRRSGVGKITEKESIALC